MAQLVMGADARIQAASDPLLLGGKNRDAFLGEITLRPEYRIENNTGDSLNLAAEITGRKYSRLYSDYLLGAVRATGEVRSSEFLSARATAAYTRSLAGDTLTTAIDGLVSPQSIRNSLRGDAGATWQPNARTTIAPSAFVERSTYENGIRLPDTTTAELSIPAMRAISERTRIGIRPVASLSRSGGQPTTHRFAGFATVDTALSQTVNLVAEAGVEHVDGTWMGIDTPVPFARKPATAFSGMARLCHMGERNDACLNAALGADISPLYGFQRRFSTGASLSRKLDTRRKLSGQIDYQRVWAPAGLASDGPLDSLSAKVEMEWTLTEHIALAADLQYARRATLDAGTPDSFFAGFRFRWTPTLRR